MEKVIDDKIIKNAMKIYCQEVNKYYKAGNIESSYNKPVIDLIQSFDCTAHDFSGARSGLNGENIDIKLWHTNEDINKMPPFGAIEVKKVDGVDGRARNQIIIESKKFGNVILTDNVYWMFYKSDSDKMYNGFQLLIKNENNEFEIDKSKVDLFIATIKDFVLEKPNEIRSSNRLAYYMSEYARTIKTIVFNILQTDSSKPMYNELYALYSRLKEELLPDLDIKTFSDMYAQTIVYGLFIARYNDKTTENFTRGEAIENLSKESHLLKQFFQHIATSEELHPTLDDSITKLCNLYALTDLKKLLDQYEKKDAIVHFYEDFLTYYDIEQKKEFGAYYTPIQVVDYIVNMVDKSLIDDFNIDKGLANNDTITINVKCQPYTERKKVKNEKKIDVPKVAILDPACGTGTFGAEIIKYIKNKYFSNGNEIFYKDWLQEKNAISDINSGNGRFQKIAYRIFDDRWTYYTGKQNGFYCRARNDVMKNFNIPNCALCFTRTDKSPRDFSMIFVTDKITESCYLTTQTSGIVTVAPLYLIEENEDKTINFNQEIFKQLTVNLKNIPNEQDVFDYCYGILFDRNYIQQYNEFLKVDYPKVPIIKDEDTFKRYVEVGSKLRQLHLMKTNTQKNLEIESSNQNLLIDLIKYENGKLQINKDTSIIGITEDVWEYYMGGYQVIDKWLKSHKGELLSMDYFNHLKRIVGIIEETIKIQNELL